MRIVMIGAGYVGLVSGACLADFAKAPIRLVETLVDVNDKRKTAMAAKVVTACGGSVAGKRIAVLGLTYRPRTDDMRELRASSSCLSCKLRALASSPTIRRAFGRRSRCFPASSSPRTPTPASEARMRRSSSPNGDEFRALDLARVKAALATPTVIDLRNIYPIRAMRAHGFRYVCVGRGFGGEG
jgi:UDPglucose 6-dehydrogenase